MASSFLRRRAQQQAERIDKEFGSTAYGGTKSKVGAAPTSTPAQSSTTENTDTRQKVTPVSQLKPGALSETWKPTYGTNQMAQTNERQRAAAETQKKMWNAVLLQGYKNSQSRGKSSSLTKIESGTPGNLMSKGAKKSASPDFGGKLDEMSYEDLEQLDELTQRQAAAIDPQQNPEEYDNAVRRGQSIRQRAKQAREEQLGKASAGKVAAGVGWKGANEIASSVSAALAAAENLIMKPMEWLTGDDTLSDSGMFNKWNKSIQEEGQYFSETYDPEFAKAGRVGELLGKYGPATIAAIPQAVLAYATAGQSLAAQSTTAGVMSAGAAAQSTGLVGTLSTAAREMVQSPQYWASFFTTVGKDYEQALSDGASEMSAYTYATVNSLLNALVEIGGGGIDELPDETKGFVRNWVETMLDEGKEEVIQGAVAQLVQNVIYNKGNALASLTSEDAVVNPDRMVQEFLGGAVVGGVLGGAQMGANRAMRYVYDTQTGKQVQMSQTQYDLVQAGMTYDAQSESYTKAAQIARNLNGSDGAVVSSKDIGELYRLMRSEAAQYGPQAAGTRTQAAQAVENAAAEMNGGTAAKVMNPMASVWQESAGLDAARADAAAEVAERVMNGDTTLTNREIEKLKLQDAGMRAAFEQATGAELPNILNRSEAVKTVREMAESRKSQIESEQQRVSDVARQMAEQAAQAEEAAQARRAQADEQARSILDEAVTQEEQVRAEAPAQETATQEQGVRLSDGSTQGREEFVRQYMDEHPGVSEDVAQAKYADAVLLNEMGQAYPVSQAAQKAQESARDAGVSTDTGAAQTQDTAAQGRHSVAPDTQASAQTQGQATKAQEWTVKNANYVLGKKKGGPTVVLDFSMDSTENGYFDADTNTIRLNGNKLTNQQAIVYTLGHELTHAADVRDSGALVNQLLEFAEKTYGAEGLEQRMDETRETYIRFYMSQGLDRAAAEAKCSTEFISQEVAADVMRGVFLNTGGLYQLARENSSLLSRARDLASDMAQRLTAQMSGWAGEATSARAQYNELTRLVSKMDRALRQNRAGDTMNAHEEVRSSVDGREQGAENRAGDEAVSGAAGRVPNEQGTGDPGRAGETGRVDQILGRDDGGLKVKHFSSWIPEAVVEPAADTPAAISRETVRGYAVSGFVLSSEIMSSHGSGTAFAQAGQIYISDALTPEMQVAAPMHELVHTMKQLEFDPYGQFVVAAWGQLRPGNTLDAMLASVMRHRKIPGGVAELGDLSLETQRDILDEFNATLYGSYVRDAELVRNHFGDAFEDLDSYVANLENLLNQFKNRDTTKDRRYSVDSFDGGIDQDRVREIAATPEFQQWFHDGNGELRDPDTGLPLLLYHGTQQAGYTRFEQQRTSEPGFWFARHPGTSDAAYYTGRESPIDPQTREFVPKRLTDWDSVNSYLRENYPMLHMETDPDYDGGIAEITDSATGDILGAYSLDEAGLEKLNRHLQDLKESADDQDNPGLYQVFLSMENPLVVNCGGAKWNALTPDMTTDTRVQEAVRREAIASKTGEGGVDLAMAVNAKFMPAGAQDPKIFTRHFTAVAQEYGYDGVIFKDVLDGRSETQVKSTGLPPELDAQIDELMARHDNFGFPDMDMALIDYEIMGTLPGLTDAADIAVLDAYTSLPSATVSVNEVPDSDYVVFKSEQVKSVHNTGTFDAADPDIRYSVSSKDIFAKQVDSALDESLDENRHNALYIRDTPNLLGEVGLGDLPLCITAKHVQNMVTAKGENSSWHGLTRGLVKRLPELLSNPVMILDSYTRPGDVVVVTSAVDGDGNPVIAAIHPNGEATVDGSRGPANFITSVYGKENFWSWVENNAEHGNVLYWNEKKSQTLADTAGVQFPGNTAQSGSNQGQTNATVARVQFPGSVAQSGSGTQTALPKALTALDSDTIIRQHKGYVKENIPERRFSVDDKDKIKTGGNTGNVNPDTGYERGSVADSFARIWNTGDRKAALSRLEQAAQTLAQAEAEMAEQRQNELVSRVFRPKLTEDVLTRNRRTIDALIEKYGAMEQTSAAQQEVRLPRQIDSKTKTAGFMQTAAAARVTNETVQNELAASILNGDAGATYVPVGDKGTMEQVSQDFEKRGISEMQADWDAIVRTGKGTGKFGQVSKLDIARAEQLYVEACNSKDVATAQRLAAEIAAVGTQAGQTVQAMTLLKKMTPAGNLYYIQKAVDRLNKNQSGRHQDITIDPALAKNLLEANTRAEIDTAMDALIQNLADQVPVTLGDKWNAWRYLAMLGNPRTHIRNVFGNAVFVPARLAKDAIAQTMELALPREQRTKGWGFTNSEMLDFARQDAKVMEDTLRGGGKYNPADMIRDKRRIFKTPLNAVEKFNSNALEAEDWVFLRTAYTHALSGYLNARGADVATLSGEGSTREGRTLLNQARDYAVREAQRATYRDASKLASTLNSLKRNSGRWGGILLEGVLPFTKTPVNIVKRGVEYSPVGIIQGLTDMTTKVRTGEMDAATAIDELAAGMTGTGIVALGAWLTSLGMLTGGLGDDDDDQFRSLQGEQEYALNIGGHSYTIDWMAPVALPLFVGAEIYGLKQGDHDLGLDDILDGLTTIAEPMLSLSMLDGLNQTLSANKYDSEDMALYNIVKTMLTSYASQGVPTLFGQVARTIDGSRRSTFTPTGMGKVESWLNRTWQSSVQGKIPFYEEGKVLYVDAWGRTDTESSIAARAIENFLSPGYLNRLNTTDVDAELTRLAEATGDSGVYPDKAKKYFSVDGETYAMTQDEYQAHLIDRGQTSYRLVNDIVHSEEYTGLTEDEKAKAVELAYQYAADLAKMHTTETYQPSEKWINSMTEFVDRGGDAAEYLMLKAKSNGSVAEAAYADNSVDVGTLTELVYQEVSTFADSFTDPYMKGYEYVMDESQQAKFKSIYREKLEEGMAELVDSEEYRTGDAEMRKKLISDLKSQVNADTKRDMSDWLFYQDIFSTPKD